MIVPKHPMVRLRPFEVDGQCRSERHVVRFDGERLVADAHDEVRERTLSALGFEPPVCTTWPAAVVDAPHQCSWILSDPWPKGWPTGKGSLGFIAAHHGEPEIERPDLFPKALARLGVLLAVAADFDWCRQTRACIAARAHRWQQGRYRIELGDAPDVRREKKLVKITLPRDWLTTVWLFGIDLGEEVLPLAATPTGATTWAVTAVRWGEDPAEVHTEVADVRLTG